MLFIRLFILSLAILMILFGTALLYFLPQQVQSRIEKKLQLKISTENYARFTKVPIPLTVKFYLFNISNSEQVLKGLERPRFEQVGPFMYKQWRRREVVDFLDNNRRIKYREYKTFYPMFKRNNRQQQVQQDIDIIAQNSEEEHYLDPYDFNVTIINVPLLSILTKLSQIEGGVKRFLAEKIGTNLIVDGKEKILVSKRASELLFDGYKVALLEAAEDLISTTLGFNYEPPLLNNKFGFFYKKNDSWNKNEAGEMTVFTGRENSMDKFMLVENWNGLKKLNVWPNNTVAGDRCNEIRGTDGSQFHPNVDKQKVLSIFSPMVCTSIDIRYKADTSVKGIPLYRYSTGPETFGAPKKSARNACYCTIPDPVNGSNGNHQAAAITRKAINQSRCYLDGLIDLSLCQKGAPIAASSPHFYQADPMLAMASGLKPDAKLHETYLDIEPMTGAVMRAASRAQLNAFVEPSVLSVIPSRIIGNMTPMVAPLLWLEESAEIDEKSATKVKYELLRMVNKVRCICTGAIIIGIVVIIATALHWWYFDWYSMDVVVAKRRKPAQRKFDRMNKRREQWAGRSRRSQLDANLRQATSGGKAAKSADDSTEPSASTAGKALVAGAVVLSAAEALAARRRKLKRRSRRADYEPTDGDDDDDDEIDVASSSEDCMSKQGLVSNEWPQAATSSSASSSHSNAANNNRPQSQNEDKDDDADLIGGPMTSAL